MLVCRATSYAQESVFSGPQPGEKLPALTVLIANKNLVTASFAIQQPGMAVDAEPILAELVKLIGGTPPKLRDLEFPYYIAKPDVDRSKPQRLRSQLRAASNACGG